MTAPAAQNKPTITRMAKTGVCGNGKEINLGSNATRFANMVQTAAAAVKETKAVLFIGF